MGQRLHWVALLLPVVALLELGAHLLFASRAPDPEAYGALREPVDRLWRPGDAIVVAPRWAEPLARAALSSRVLEVERVAGPDLSSASRAVEISLLSATEPATRDWQVAHREQIGPFEVSVRQNPTVEAVVFDFVAALSEGRAEVYRTRAGARSACRWLDDAPRRTGGLHGALALPARRFECPGGHYAAVSILDDQDYRPRRCILVSAPRDGELVLAFQPQRQGSKLVGHVGSSFFLTRGEHAASGSVAVRVGAQNVGRVVHRGAAGWAPFSFGLTPPHPGRIEFRVTRGSIPGASRETLCLQAELR